MMSRLHETAAEAAGLLHPVGDGSSSHAGHGGALEHGGGLGVSPKVALHSTTMASYHSQGSFITAWSVGSVRCV